MKLRKETIQSIKHFLKYEANKHKYGTWDKLEITYVKIYVNGQYSFKVHYLWKEAGKFDDYNVKGNLEDYPMDAVLDCLDVAQLIFYPIHKKAYERLSEYCNLDMKMNEEQYEYIKKIYNIDK